MLSFRIAWRSNAMTNSGMSAFPQLSQECFLLMRTKGVYDDINLTPMTLIWHWRQIIWHCTTARGGNRTHIPAIMSRLPYQSATRAG